MVEVTPSNPVTEDGSTRPSPLGENLDNVITKNTAGNLQTQNNIQTDGLTTPKYRKASSPASYVFFSRESEKSPVIVKVNEHAKNNTSSGLTYGASYDGMKQSVQYSFSDNRKEEIDDRASQLLILQQLLLESEDNLTAVSPRPASQPLSNCLNNAEATVDNGTKADEDNEVHSALLDSEAAQTSGYCCSCGDHCSYVSDSMLDEDYLFFDTSLELSLSDDEGSETPSKFGNLGNEAEENNEEQDRKKAASQDIYRERRMDSCSENLNIFQSSLAAILCHDNITLRNLCLSHLFISSFTDEEGKTLLHHAASQEDTIICQVLLDTTVGMVNIDQQDMFGKTALHYAVQNGNTKTIKLLLDNGAKLEIPDENSKTVLDIGLWKIQAK
ncbi:uncharacterized protein LOC142098681 [Mixophyes fleayi]|uniref:uncharacterized protein LOC142098681 n=1 Tax=Mixophyes fleayi TaxID=3061075 RepID=UPI003F4DE72D